MSAPSIRASIKVAVLALLSIVALGLTVTFILRFREHSRFLECKDYLGGINGGIASNYLDYQYYLQATYSNWHNKKTYGWPAYLIVYLGVNKYSILKDPKVNDETIEELGVRIFSCTSFSDNITNHNYIGVSGIGSDAVNIRDKDNPDIGFLGDGRKLKQADVKKGLHSLITICESKTNIGKWYHPREATVRSIDINHRKLSESNQFGSMHRINDKPIVNALFLDGSVRSLSDKMLYDIFVDLCRVNSSRNVDLDNLTD